MKKIGLISIAMMLIFILSSCGFKDIETSEKIIAPQNTLPPISGQWKVEKYKVGNVGKLTKEDVEKILGQIVLFHEKVVVIGNDLCLDPAYKIKNVNSLDYLLYQYKINPEYLGIKNKKIQVITMTSQDQSFYEFIKESDDKIIVNIDGVFFYLTKISDDLDEKEIDKYLNKGERKVKDFELKNDEVLRSGLLLGLKYYDDGDSEGEENKFKYRTIWISGKNKAVDKIYETDDLFVPRKSGFWKVGVDRIVFDKSINDTIYAYPLNKESNTIGLQDISFEGEQKIFKSINYIGNDYISIEIIDDGLKDRAVLQVLPIDNINDGKPIKISDIVGESGKNAFYEGATRTFSNYNTHKNFVDMKPVEESFGLTRRNGHWVMKGRINFSDEDKESFADFNIKTIPPKELVNYDELAISWNAVKLRVPQAIDVFTSPNEDIAAVITHNSILIYTIEKGELSNEPIKKVQLNSGEKVVMNEWATGKYIYLWEEEFLKNTVSEIKE